VKNLKNLNDLIGVSKKILKKIKPNDKICIVHHDDSDGCCSAALFSIIIHDLIGDYPEFFPVTGLEKINRGLIKRIKSIYPDHVFVFDMSVEPKEFSDFKGFVLDHHIFSNIESREKMPYLNPRIYEKNDEKVPPTCCIVFRLLQDLLLSKGLAWIAGIGITEDHRVELCSDVFEIIKNETPDLLKVKNIDQENLEKSVFGEFSDMVRSGRMIRGVEGAKTAVWALIECKDRPDKFINGLTRHSLALRRFYEKLTYATQNILKDVEKYARFHKKQKAIFYEQEKTKIRGMTSFLSDKIRQKYPEWIICVMNKEYGGRKSKISIRLEQKKRNENLVSILEKIKEKIPSLRGGGHKSAIGVIINAENVSQFEEEFLNSIK
jgi:single-stranded DNA-specific DHH superfamily exonuclease